MLYEFGSELLYINDESVDVLDELFLEFSLVLVECVTDSECLVHEFIPILLEDLL